MNICKNCKFWLKGERGNYEIIPIDEDTYVPKKMPFEVRYCRDPRLMTFERPLEIDQASVADGSNYRAVLMTAENFGCNHFEKGTN